VREAKEVIVSLLLMALKKVITPFIFSIGNKLLPMNADKLSNIYYRKEDQHILT